MNPYGVITGTIGLLVVGFLVFRKVRHDYRQHGQLTRISVALELIIFFLHGAGSYLFLDAVIAHIDVTAPSFWAAVVLLVVGLVGVITAMSRLTWTKSVGREVTSLRTTGLYQYTRNPQILAYGLIVLGYALLWPSWSGILWVVIYGAIGHMMVLTEEEHLKEVYGVAYEDYCRSVPRYLGLNI
jgi:protein-S-isoprenylcysteine O-methyltransferase Ste14